jgi:hypothetical protein
VNLVKTTSSDENPFILIFRISGFNVAKTFQESFNDGDLKSTIKSKLQSFSNEENCFSNEDIHFDIEIDPDDFEKVLDTLRNPEERKSRTRKSKTT